MDKPSGKIEKQKKDGETEECVLNFKKEVSERSEGMAEKKNDSEVLTKRSRDGWERDEWGR